MKIKSTMYLNGCKESNQEDFWELCKQMGITPSDEALRNSAYALYEVSFGVEVDTDTGNVEILTCNGKELKDSN